MFEITEETTSELETWNFDPESHWSIDDSKTTIGIEGPLSQTRIPAIEAGEKIVFVRHFEGHRHNATYYELNQKISQVLCIHHLDDRNAWCVFDENGDIDEIVKIHQLEPMDGDEPSTVVTIRRERLTEFATAGSYVLLRMFDLTRFRPDTFSGWGDGSLEEFFGTGNSVFGKISRHGSIGSYSRGIQIVNLSGNKSESKCNLFSQRLDKKYESFIAHDWRYQVVDEFSCDPKKLSNYFQPTNYPFEISPAFFRPEVLSKYKASPEKYTIDARSISCRGSWRLKAIGDNDANQVHAYLGYLATLPHTEQLHWKQFNERPKAPLSPSVIATDFEGRWYVGYDPLMSLLERIRVLNCTHVDWWKLRNADLLKRVHLPLTDTLDEWSNELMNLDKLLVEGLQEKWLRTLAEKLGRKSVDRLRSLKLVEECLIALGFESERAKDIMSPWHEVHNLRSELKGHASNSTHENERVARKSDGSLCKHFVNLCDKLIDSLAVVSKAFNKKLVDVKTETEGASD